MRVSVKGDERARKAIRLGSPWAWVRTLLALGLLGLIIAANVVIWPFTYLGYDIDLPTPTLAAIVPDSSADRGGLQVGDHILSLYGHPWDEVVGQWSLLPLIEPRDRPVHISVERAGSVINADLIRQPPSASFQAAKAVLLVLSLLCWLTGYLLGTVRRQEVTGLPVVAIFWLALSAVLGTYSFARFASFPLQVCLQWALVAVLAPLAISIHSWFPSRPMSPRRARRARFALVGSWLCLNGALVGLVILQRPPLLVFLHTLYGLSPIALGAAFVGSTAVLYRAYHQVQIAHLRRQIRLIAAACLVVALFWFALLVVPRLVGGPRIANERWIDLLAGLVPLAYLAGGLMPNLYELERMVLRVGLFVATAAALTAVGVVALKLLRPSNDVAVLCLVLGTGVLVRPVSQLAGRLFPPQHSLDRSYHALNQATHALTTTLERNDLITMLQTGIGATFHHPAFGFYSSDGATSGRLRRVRNVGLPDLPEHIERGAFTAALCAQRTVVPAQALPGAVATASLSPNEQHALYCPGVALWCPIVHAQGELLGLMLIGPDPNLDPYHDADLRRLHRLLDAATLAFTNSAAYQQQRDAEATIHQLFVSLQQAQDDTAATIARELHDEIINDHVQLNIAVLERLLESAGTPAPRDELEALLLSQQSLSDTVRDICEELHPTGLDDPRGLPGLLRLQLERSQAIWSGTCALEITGQPRQIEPNRQREVLRIVREALANALKHADATTITVTVTYPATEEGVVSVAVADNGRSGKVVQLRPNHWGLRNMMQSARIADGALTIEQTPGSGTTIVCTVPAGYVPEDTRSDASVTQS